MISTHILDTSLGMPAPNVAVTLEKKDGETWHKLAEGRTNSDGRYAFNCPALAGDYRLTFFLEEYFQGKESFFLNTPISFRVQDINRKYHVPLLLNPFGLSTYRGS